MPDNRTRIPLVFGRGIDRETGQMALQPGSMHDLRNVYTQEGKYVVRRGLERKLTILYNGVEVDAILAIQDLPQEGVQIVVAWWEEDRELLIYRLTGNVSQYEFLAVWAVLEEEILDDPHPPKIRTTQVGGMVFMAHDEPRFGLRAPTMIYEPTAVIPIRELTANFLDPELDEEEAVYFRGVTEHLGLTWGWGYGSPNEYRPELVRVAEPKEPANFDRESYFIAKPIQEPVLDCTKARSTLLVFKPTSTWQIVGSGIQDFGIIPYDPLYGLLGTRLAVNVSGDVFFWSHSGPRVASDDGPSVSLELPLGLLGVEPGDLVAAVDANEAFAAYEPRRRCVWFVFGQRAYVLSLWNPQDPRWSYYPLGPNTFSAGLIRRQDDLPCPTGFPAWSDPDLSNFDVRIQWTNVGQTGGEIYEIWLMAEYYGWELVASDLVSPNETQSRLIDPALIEPGTLYEGAIRYRRGGCYADEYASSDPSTWPAISRGSFISPLSTPDFDDVEWSRIDMSTEQVLLSIGVAHPDVDVEIWRAEQDDVDTLPASGDYVLLHIEENPPADFTYADQAIDGERYYSYRIRHVTPTLNGNYAIRPGVWTGPWPGPAVVPMTTGIAVPLTGYAVKFSPGLGNETLVTEVWDNWERSGSVVVAFPEELADTKAAGLTSHAESGLWDSEDRPDSTPLTVGVRHKQTSFSVDDFSPFSLGMTGCDGHLWNSVYPEDSCE